MDRDDDGATDETVRQGPAGTLEGHKPHRARTDPAVAQTIAQGSEVDSPPATEAPPTTPLRGPGRAPGAAAVTRDSRYRVGELIGKGGMGEVLAAFDEQIGREVAIKRIRADEPGDEARARFEREARVQGQLEHPAVVPVHDLAIDERGRPFFVMKRLSGTVMSDLLAALRAGDVADEATARRRLLRAFAEVCLAVEFAHSKGIVHRDLKPANIMLGDFGEVYVLDWGIARAVGETEGDTGERPDLALSTGETRAGTVLGTPAYMAPEQLAGERVGAAADLYALGCILYEIVAGEGLHQTRRSYTNIAAGIEAKPSRVRGDVPPELDVICEHATRLDPAARPPSARAIGDAVQAYLDGDRDVVQRKELARVQIAEARAAIAAGDDAEHRRVAMRAAGRALALDPTASEAADLVTHLVLRPPEHEPPEVEQALVAIDVEVGRRQGRLAALSMIGYLGFVPLLLWTGVRDTSFVIAFAALAIASSLQVYAMTRRERIYRWRIYTSALIHALLIGLVCRMVGPFIIAPTLVATTLMAYAAHPRFGQIGVVAGILAASVIVPWGLEIAGVVSRTYEFIDGTIVLHSSIISFRSAPVQVAFAVLLVALLAVVALLTRQTAERQRDASRRVEMQAWHLRQLVPTASDSR